MWNLPGPGIEPVSPDLKGRFLSTVPPGKSQKVLKKYLDSQSEEIKSSGGGIQAAVTLRFLQ